MIPGGWGPRTREKLPPIGVELGGSWLADEQVFRAAAASASVED